MAQPYVGEIRLFAGNFNPAGWEFCWGQLLSISENETLFNLIGTTYGGDGQENFGLPDLRGRVPLHQGTGSDGITYVEGEVGGVETVTLTSQQMPTHSHPALANQNDGDLPDPGGNLPARTTTPNKFLYLKAGSGNPNTQFVNTAVQPVGGSQPHENMQPYLAVSFIISLFGIFPSPT